jgi:hypothetical protein
LGLAAAALLARWLGVGAITVALVVLGFAAAAHFGGWAILIGGVCHKCSNRLMGQWRVEYNLHVYAALKRGCLDGDEVCVGER